MTTASPELLPPESSRPPQELFLSLAGHLEELRRRLGLSLAALFVAVGVSLVWTERLIRWLQQPVAGFLPRLAYFSPVEPLMAYLQVACLSGVMLAMPVILWQGWGFIRSGLTPRERSSGFTLIVWGSAQFLAGAAFAHYGLVPVSLRFLLGIGSDFLQPVISIGQYLSFVTTLIFWCGIIFELPVVLVVLARIGIVTSEWLRQQRPYAILALVILAAIVTPTTDPVNLLLLTMPLILLYELSIHLARFAGRHPP